MRQKLSGSVKLTSHKYGCAKILLIRLSSSQLIPTIAIGQDERVGSTTDYIFLICYVFVLKKSTTHVVVSC